MNRKDKHTAKIVDTVIQMADRGHVQSAAKFAKGGGVSIETFLRVILRPKQRRLQK